MRIARRPAFPPPLRGEGKHREAWWRAAAAHDEHERETCRRHPPPDRGRAGGSAGRHRNRGRPHCRDRAGRRSAEASSPCHAGPCQCSRPCEAAVADLVRRSGQAARDLAPASRGDAADRSLSRRARRLRPRGARGRRVGHGALHPLSRTHAAGRGGARRRPRRSRRRPARDARRLHARPQSARLSATTEASRLHCRRGRARRWRRSSLRPCPASKSRSRASKRSPQRSRAKASRSSSAPTARNGARTRCLPPSRERSRATGRRVHMHLLETRYQRAFADRAYPGGRHAAPEDPRAAIAATDPRPLRPCARRRSRPHRRIRCGHRDQSEFEPAPSKRSRSDQPMRSGADVASLSASTPRPSTRTTTSCANCGLVISCTADGASTKS